MHTRSVRQTRKSSYIKMQLKQLVIPSNKTTNFDHVGCQILSGSKCSRSEPENFLKNFKIPSDYQTQITKNSKLHDKQHPKTYLSPIMPSKANQELKNHPIFARNKRMIKRHRPKRKRTKRRTSRFDPAPTRTPELSLDSSPDGPVSSCTKIGFGRNRFPDFDSLKDIPISLLLLLLRHQRSLPYRATDLHSEQKAAIGKPQ